MKFLAMAVGLIFLAGCSGPSSQTAPEDAGAKAVVATVYEGFSTGDIALATSTMAPDIVWNEAEGNPYADKNPYEGPDAVVTGLFARLGGDWDGFTASARDYVVDGNRVVVFGRYTGTYKATGKAMDAPFVHSWTVGDGRIVAFQQYTDTAEYVAVMVLAPVVMEADAAPSDVEDFARRYAEAWSSQDPQSVAVFFGEAASLTVNDGTPATGRDAITEVARGFMTAFPDLRITFDRLSTDGGRTLFHWTLTGTNTGPEGTGNAVEINGAESWVFGPDGLIAESLGRFDADEYARQLAED